VSAGPLYPHVEVQLSGRDGNAFAILGVVQGALRRQVGETEASVFYEEATSGDYDHLLQTAMRWVTVE
jgi:hypothetical protein